ncbi:TPA: uracil phosphoribosyltransferase [Patescibacteria group bacterium]|nr:uracil phosphoribosyltransferase [Patescibacteria group bacterium]
MNNFTILDNPVLQNVGLKLHDVQIKPYEYRKYTRLLGLYMGIELSGKNVLPIKKVTTKTPLGSLTTNVIDDCHIGIVNILRAGTTMALGMADVLPNSTISFVSAWRRSVNGKMVADTDYNRGVGDLQNKFVILTDPALASGVSLLACIDVISKYIDLKKTIICCLHAAKEGIEKIYNEHPEIRIYSIFGPSDVNEHCYIVNGPGDCGDRCFNTK